MAGRIRREDIDALRERVDLAAVVSDHTKLQRAGQRLKGLCPFHQERTPSFTVDPGQGLYHCFGCGEGGDTFTFVQRIEGLTFVEAVEQLARRVGMRLHYEELSAREKQALGQRTRLVEVTTAALEFFRRALLGEQGGVARTYLRERGFGRDEADRFSLGFAPDAWEALSRHLQQERFEVADIVLAGLAVRTDRGGLRDRFRGRLVFPVFDLGGEPIGFGGRVLPGLDYGGHDPPKYLNSPETPLYRKQRVLYGANWARAEIVRSGEALVCEGYTDVIALHQAGCGNAVATCGTAIGEEHLRLLERYAQRVVLAFDPDEAGSRAAERAFELSRERDIDLRVLVLPPGADPADLVRREGPEQVRTRVGEAIPIVPFVLRRVIVAHDVERPEGRAGAVNSAAEILARVDDPVLRHQYAEEEVAKPLRISLDVVREAVAAAGAEVGGVAAGGVASGQGSARPAPAASAPSPARGRAAFERDLLRVVLQRDDLLPDLWAEVSEGDFSHPKARAVFTAIARAGGPGAGTGAVLEAAGDDDIRGLVRAISMEEPIVELEPAKVDAYVRDLLKARAIRLAGRIREVKGRLEALNPDTDPDTYRARFEELDALERQRYALRQAVD